MKLDQESSLVNKRRPVRGQGRMGQICFIFQMRYSQLLSSPISGYIFACIVTHHKLPRALLGCTVSFEDSVENSWRSTTLAYRSKLLSESSGDLKSPDGT